MKKMTIIFSTIMKKITTMIAEYAILLKGSIHILVLTNIANVL